SRHSPAKSCAPSAARGADTSTCGRTGKNSPNARLCCALTGQADRLLVYLTLLAFAPLNLALDCFSHQMHPVLVFLQHVGDARDGPSLQRDHETFWILGRRCHNTSALGIASRSKRLSSRTLRLSKPAAPSVLPLSNWSRRVIRRSADPFKAAEANSLGRFFQNSRATNYHHSISSAYIDGYIRIHKLVANAVLK